MEEFRPAAAIEADTDLAHAIRADDDEALRSLVDRFGAPVTATAHALTGDHAMADDVALGVFVQAWRNSERFEPGRDFGPWLLGLVTRAVGEQKPTGSRGPGDGEKHDRAQRIWAISSAVSTLPSARRHALRSWATGDAGGADGDASITAGDPDDDLARDRLRIERRVAHVVEPDDVGPLLADSVVWTPAARTLGERFVDLVASETLIGARSGDDVEVSTRTSRALKPIIIGLVAAIVVLFGTIVGLSALSGSVEPADFTTELVATGLVIEAEGGSITVTERDAGIEIDLDAPTLPRRSGDTFYRGVLVLDDGTELTVGSFAEGNSVTLFAGVALARVETFNILLDEVGGDFDGSDVVLKANVPAT